MAKVLLVEDDMPLARLYEDTLKSEHDVIAVETSAAAIAALDEECPDLMVLDLNLPDAPGTQILEYAQEHDNLSDLRVVVMTGFAHFHAEALPGVLEFLNKPVTPSTLLRVVNSVLAGDTYP